MVPVSIVKNRLKRVDCRDKTLSKTLIVFSQISHRVVDFSWTIRHRLKSKTFNEEKFKRDTEAWAKDSFVKNRARFQKSISRLNRKWLLAYCAAAFLIPSNHESLAVIEYIAVNALAHSSHNGKKVTPYGFSRLFRLASKIQQSEVWVSITPGEVRAFSARLENIILRGTGRRPDQSFKAAFYRFGAHNEWLKEHLGFTIEEAAETADALIDYVVGKLEPLLDEAKDDKDLEGSGLAWIPMLVF